MKPVLTPYTDTIFKLSGGTEENNLPVFKGRDEYGHWLPSTWELTDDERKALISGARIELTIWGTGHPPVALSVEKLDAEEVVIT